MNESHNPMGQKSYFSRRDGPIRSYVGISKNDAIFVALMPSYNINKGKLPSTKSDAPFSPDRVWERGTWVCTNKGKSISRNTHSCQDSIPRIFVFIF